MARTILDFPVQDAGAAYQLAVQIIQNEGYTAAQEQGETVFKKGKGVLTPPKYFLLRQTQNVLHVEAWHKYSVVPGVHVGEYDVNSFVGSAVKGDMKRIISALQQSFGVAVNARPMPPQGQPYARQPIPQGQPAPQYAPAQAQPAQPVYGQQPAAPNGPMQPPYVQQPKQ